MITLWYKLKVNSNLFDVFRLAFGLGARLVVHQEIGSMRFTVNFLPSLPQVTTSFAQNHFVGSIAHWTSVIVTVTIWSLLLLRLLSLIRRITKLLLVRIFIITCCWKLLLLVRIFFITCFWKLLLLVRIIITRNEWLGHKWLSWLLLGH